MAVRANADVPPFSLGLFLTPKNDVSNNPDVAIVDDRLRPATC